MLKKKVTVALQKNLQIILVLLLFFKTQIFAPPYLPVSYLEAVQR